MLLALGAASAAVDAIKSLTSSNPSAQSTGFSQASADLFGLSGGASASGNSAAASGSTGFSQISPATMSALLAAQSQSSTGSTTPASTSPASALQKTTSSGAASSSYNIIEQMIQREANAISLSTAPFSVNA